MKRALLVSAALLCALAACVFRPDYARYEPCAEDGTCAPGFRCWAEARICLPECGEQGGGCLAPPSDGGEQTDGGVNGDGGTLEPDGGDLDDAGISDGGGDGGQVPADGGVALELTGLNVLNPIEGEPYAHTFTAQGGVPPYTFDILGGELPPGIDFEDAALTGAAEAPPLDGGVYMFRVRVRDSAQPPASDDAQVVLEVMPKLRIGNKVALADGNAGSPYNDYLRVTGGKGPWTWTVLGGELPPNVSVAPDGLVTTGSANINGARPFIFTVQVTDQGQPVQVQSIELSITVQALPLLAHIRTRELVDGRTGWYYEQQLLSGGGTGTHTWTIEGGALPPGLTLTPTGRISGTPTTPGEYTVKVKVTTGLGPASRTFNMKIY